MKDIDDIIKWAVEYKKDAQHVMKAIKYHNVLPDEVLRIEGRIQAVD